MKTSMTRFAALLIGAALCVNAAADTAPAGTLPSAISRIQQAWAKATYQTPEKQQEAAFKTLAEDAHRVTAAYPDRAEPMIWEAIVLSGYAKAAGGLSALGMVKQARDLLLAAEQIDARALNGLVFTSLGSLYYKVPGWPISFRDNDKARAYLEKALAANPNGIDPNYFYGDFLFNQKDYQGAAVALRRALTAPPRPGRSLADNGRRAEIEKELKEVEAKL